MRQSIQDAIVPGNMHTDQNVHWLTSKSGCYTTCTCVMIPTENGNSHPCVNKKITTECCSLLDKN